MSLKLQAVEKKYGDLIALQEITLELTAGVYGLLGPNGAGKSTLMNLITQNLKPSRGSIYFNDRAIQELGEAYRSLLGYMPQQQNLYEDFSAQRFLSYIAALKGMKRAQAEQEIHELLDIVGLRERAHDRLGHFSGGMKQRILIAQAILNSPRILVLDEPTAGLDPKERIRIRNLISEIAGQRIVIIASHVVSDLEQIAKEVILLKKGRIIRQGSVKQLLQEVENKVFEILIAHEELESYKKRYRIANITNEADALRLRILAEDEPPTAHRVYPSLEELYLYHFTDVQEVADDVGRSVLP